MRICARVPARPSRELDPISAMSWGVEPVRRDQQGKSTIRIEWRLRHNSPNSKLNRANDETLEINEGRADQSSRLICSSVTTRSTFSVLLLVRERRRPAPARG